MQSAKIKAMRKILGMNQVKFADTLGISQGFLSDLEKGSKLHQRVFLYSLKNYTKIKMLSLKKKFYL